MVLTTGAPHGVIGRWYRSSWLTFNLAWGRHLPVPVLAVIRWSPEARRLKITHGS